MQAGIVDSDDERSQALCTVRSAPGRPLEVVVQLNDKSLSMEVDTGSSVTGIGGNVPQPVRRSATDSIHSPAAYTVPILVKHSQYWAS